MPGRFSYSKAAVERAMKVQEVMLRAWAKKITWWQAAEILGISDRHLRRIREGYEKFGYFSLLDKRRGQPSPKRVLVAGVGKVLALYGEKYFDLKVRHFHEKLREQHAIDLSYSWVKSALQGAGLADRTGRRRSGDGINSAVLETCMGGAGKVLEADLPKTERHGTLVRNSPFGASAIESRPTRTQEGFS